MKHWIFTTLLYMLLLADACAQQISISNLRNEIISFVASSNAKVGVALAGLDFDDSLTVSGSVHFPMQSVYKFPLALFILHEVDRGRFSLDQKIHIPKQSLDTATWSPLVRDFPHQDIDLSLESLLTYTVGKSDNNGCDVLFRLAGGTWPVNLYIHGLGVKDIAIAATEAEMKKAWPVQYTNWCTPQAMLRLLRLFYKRKVLKKTSNDLLMKIMLESTNSPNRIKGRLPANTELAHKTGTSNTNGQDLTAGTNDVGIVTLPNGKHLAIVVFVSDYKGGVTRGESIIAQIAKLAWDHYSSNPR